MKKFINVKKVTSLMLKKLLRSRRITNIIQKKIYMILPPILLDQKWFCWALYYPFFKNKTKYLFNFRENTHLLSEDEYNEYYRITDNVLGRKTDIGINGFTKLINKLTNRNILDVGCGNGYLAKKLSLQNNVTAVDININQEIISENPDITFQQSNMENLPFDDNSFEVVISTHALEHVLEFDNALKELRRVAQKELYIIVPIQRPNRYTPDLHISFFPYPESFLLRVKPLNEYHYEILDGDLYYVEYYDYDNTN